MSRESQCFYKNSKNLNRLQKAFLALWALYATGCHVGDLFDPGLEVKPCITSETAFRSSGFLDQLKAITVEPFTYALSNIGRVERLSIRDNLGFPHLQKRQQIELTRLSGAFPGQAVSEVSARQTANNGASDTAANEALQDHVVRIVWGLVGGIIGGALGGLAGAYGFLLFAGEIDLPKFSLRRRSKSGELENPYESRPNTNVLNGITEKSLYRTLSFPGC